MVHPLVNQLHFSRSEFVRGLENVTAAAGVKRFEPINSISWIIGHLANQENYYWVYLAQGVRLAPELRKLVGTGRPATTPPLEEMWSIWKEITSTADHFLTTLTRDDMVRYFSFRNQPWPENIGTLLLRNTHHYWFHLGEGMAIRQMLGSKTLPEFVGNMEKGSYTPE